MAGGRFPEMRTVGIAYRDVGRVFRAMPALVGIVLVFLFVLNFIEEFFVDEPARSAALSFVIAIVRGFLLTPFLIAVHRYILLDEITSRFVIAPREPRFFRFFGWSLALEALVVTGAWILDSLPAAGLPLAAATTFGIVTVIFAIIVTIRLTILFPAIAVDAPGATVADAFADTKGYFWTIITITLMASLPVIVLMVLPALFFAGRSFLVDVLVMTGVELVIYPLLVAIASRLFQSLAERTVHREAP